MKQKHIVVKKTTTVGPDPKKIKVFEEGPDSGSKRRKVDEVHKSFCREEGNETPRTQKVLIKRVFYFRFLINLV